MLNVHNNAKDLWSSINVKATTNKQKGCFFSPPLKTEIKTTKRLRGFLFVLKGEKTKIKTNEQIKYENPNSLECSQEYYKETRAMNLCHSTTRAQNCSRLNE